MTDINRNEEPKRRRSNFDVLPSFGSTAPTAQSLPIAPLLAFPPPPVFVDPTHTFPPPPVFVDTAHIFTPPPLFVDTKKALATVLENLNKNSSISPFIPVTDAVYKLRLEKAIIKNFDYIRRFLSNGLASIE